MAVETSDQDPNSARNTELMRDFVETTAGLPQQPTPLIRAFSADSAGFGHKRRG